MTIQLEQPAAPAQPTAGDVSDDPFELDIAIIENTPETETILMCGTGDNCGSSCPSACSGSTV
ncbi:FxLD family lantipeptide [Streptomyces ipomoeae]|jgi:FxLD family lantipeptide|uniref:FxLD family lantipeptide n=1 Tax=Streptomyces ipomoeae TaxID=103232 RepID=A0AAE9AX64_9ACTN|nr:FxLD family lanthipeptide [Streptomyces ipomoeae]MDX2699276.1 FxLD family lanthipeptide [Streptomyces ipomoeae]MDX2826712.1 FxLD family lanthipeptide [Streptomyces ipomoeae]MDX2844987.1 FxLD family lanthipeptide [Streptomyces ipomoeae]MDX2875642.1 FxLD family lanthipeptide [Streptomyces ipomoeae]TQE21158.1 FxLD family lantipeptide [Streptomyces ipomoeae]